MRYEDNVAQMRRFAWGVKRRASAMGISGLGFDDIMQELAIAWCKARDRYDPNGGAKFSTFLERGMKLHMMTFMRDRVGRDIGSDFDKVFLDASESEGNSELHEIIASTDPAPDIVADRRNRFEKMARRLSATARIYVRLLATTPPELQCEVGKIEARNALGRAKGMRIPVCRELTSTAIFEFMGVPRKYRTGILREIETVANEL